MTAIVLSILLSVSVNTSAPSDSDREVIVEQALDQPTTLTIADAPLGDAFRVITDQTGLSITVGPDALSFLPYGESTHVNVQLENVRLRQGVEAICTQLAMTYRTTPSGVEIVPSDALERLGRRATWDEIETISNLMQHKWTGSDEDLDLVRSSAEFQGDCSWDALRPQLLASGTGPAERILTHATEAAGCTWYPLDKGIVILPQEKQVERCLERTVSLRCHSRELAEVLRGLSRQAGVSIKLDPAAAAELPLRVKQSFSLLAEGVTVEEALQQIAIAAGLAYRIEPGAVVLHSPDDASNSQPAQTTVLRSADPIVGKIVIPASAGGYQFEFFIRESDLSDEENALRRQAIDHARQAMHEELRQHNK